MDFTPVILIHTLAAAGALVTGAVALRLSKGTRAHRQYGRLWIALMLAAALTSFGIRSSGHFSWIHLLPAFTLASVGASVVAIANGRVHIHRRSMTSAYIGLVSAGLFALLPERRLGHLVWHAAGLL